MPVLAGERIFTVAGTPYAWQDLVLAGCMLRATLADRWPASP
jgi:hypothetical protein